MSKKLCFEPVDLKINFPALEKQILIDWYKKGIVKKYLARNKSSKKIFSFLDGPITANNPMGVHHAWGRTYKDIWQRYKNMRGYRQRFQNGFDSQGLWVEVEVEKELGFKSKKDIENYGVEKFVQKCKDRVLKYSKIQTEQSKRLGYFMDWEHSYYTMSDENNYMIWYFLKKCHDNGWIYKGCDVVPWCPRCETAISQHEILTEDYKELTHDSIYLKLPIRGRDREFLLIWTTTPWTIPVNTAVAVDESLEYVLVRISSQERFWVAKDLVEKVFKDGYVSIDKILKGKDLVGLKYKSPFDDLPVIKKALKENTDKMHLVVVTDKLLMPISTEEGTGLVHTSTSTGEEDHKLGKKLGLPVVPAINDTADYLDGFGEFSGLNAKKHPELIFNYLKQKENQGENWIFAIVSYKHRYPACWRCKTELVWKVTDEWYIAMDKPLLKTSDGKRDNRETLRERMIEITKKIKWIPEFGLERELDWLKNMHDWLISKKNRYWGLALPIWECQKCGKFEVVGAKEELKEKAISGWDGFETKTPHKPQIDAVKIKCENCGGMASRIEPVGNPWLDAGIVSFSTITENNKGNPLYLSAKKEWGKWYPAEFITESFPGQFKNWFYSLIAMSAVLENKEPFKTVLGFATLLAEDGQPMHKSSGNMIEFDEGAEKIGADVMRWMYVRQNPSENLLFGYKLADEVRRRFHLKLWNVYNFFVTYANLDGWIPTPKNFGPNANLLQNIKFETSNSKLCILDKWILARLNYSIEEVSKSLDKFDASTASLTLEEFVDDLSNWYVRRSRDRIGPWAISQEDKKCFYETTYSVLITLTKLLSVFTPFLAEKIYKNLTKNESVHLTNWPVQNSKSKTQDSKLISGMREARNIVEKIHAARKEAGIPIRQPLNSFSSTSLRQHPLLEKLIKDETNIKKINWKAKKDKLDINITQSLEEEAKVRQLIREIQEQRKKMGLKLTQKCTVYCKWLPKEGKLLERIKRKTLCSQLIKAEELKIIATR